MKKKSIIEWLTEPQKHNYPAAFSYLSLLYDEDFSKKSVKKLKAASVVNFKAKDIFRASSLSLLGVSNFHVKADSIKIENAEKLSPLLLVRDRSNGKAIIADGYHRLCAVYLLDEDAVIPCKII
ncbi:MAG: hypothetical protein ABI199_06790 [Bacteroidia bacterium]